MVFLYDGTYEGFLTAVFDVYATKRQSEALICPTDSNASLPLDAWVETVSDSAKADRVAKRLIALEIAETVFDAWLSREEEIENHLLSVVSLALREQTTPLQRLWHPDVRVVVKAAGRVGNEAHRYLQFVRFVKIAPNQPALTDGTETPGLYVADIEPEYDIPNMYLRESQAFIQSIETGVKDRNNIDNILESAKLLDYLYQSAARKQEVSF